MRSGLVAGECWRACGWRFSTPCRSLQALDPSFGAELHKARLLRASRLNAAGQVASLFRMYLYSV